MCGDNIVEKIGEERVPMAEVEVSGLSLQQDGKMLCSREKWRRGEGRLVLGV